MDLVIACTTHLRIYPLFNCLAAIYYANDYKMTIRFQYKIGMEGTEIGQSTLQRF